MSNISCHTWRLYNTKPVHITPYVLIIEIHFHICVSPVIITELLTLACPYGFNSSFVPLTDIFHYKFCRLYLIHLPSE